MYVSVLFSIIIVHIYLSVQLPARPCPLTSCLFCFKYVCSFRYGSHYNCLLEWQLCGIWQLAAELWVVPKAINDVHNTRCTRCLLFLQSVVDCLGSALLLDFSCLFCLFCTWYQVIILLGLPLTPSWNHDDTICSCLFFFVFSIFFFFVSLDYSIYY